MMDAFISYVADDSKLSEKIAAILEKANYTSWRYENNSVPGVSYLTQTREAINNSKVFIVLISSHSLTSKQVGIEIIHAHESNKSIIPILIDLEFSLIARRQPDWKQAMGASVALQLNTPNFEKRFLDGFAKLLIPNVNVSELKSEKELESESESNKRIDRSIVAPNKYVNFFQKKLLFVVILFIGIVVVGLFFYNSDIKKKTLTTLEIPQNNDNSVSENTSYAIPQTDGDKFHSPEKHEAGDRLSFTLDNVEFVFRWCPPGTFIMGDATLKNATPHQVTLSKGFWMGETEITQAQWEAVTGDNPSRKSTLIKEPNRSFGSDYGPTKGRKVPVNMVSWDDCQEFVEMLNKKNIGYYFSLPTEAQWEYACRAGTTTTYFFGDSDAQLQKYGWAKLDRYLVDEDGNGTLGPFVVKRKKGNSWGLFDMYGNVSEWCLDATNRSDYSKNDIVDPLAMDEGDFRVARSQNTVSRNHNSALRMFFERDTRIIDIGVRIIIVK
jgi:formylglycine-generating enzyme required for sulfatase activity